MAALGVFPPLVLLMINIAQQTTHQRAMSQVPGVNETNAEPKSRNASLSSASTETTVADTIEWQAERATKDLLRLTALLRDYKDKLEKIIECHPTLTDKQKKAHGKVLDNVDHALIHNRFDLRQTFSVSTIATVGARYAVAKELIGAVEARLETIEAQGKLDSVSSKR
ncbi:hypothetical protein EDD37DRAFT_622082 [Exophiala viscosa]|uniref:uncharacterized protein n=1 Tax=Exophiala viscosa TaxID=2486360 RepID=UPI0021976776|nr:hypothetical protein EDD37DRAFT_622082 [Exophiala viscosa]